eukprot:gene19053-25654_t
MHAHRVSLGPCGPPVHGWRWASPKSRPGTPRTQPTASPRLPTQLAPPAAASGDASEPSKTQKGQEGVDDQTSSNPVTSSSSEASSSAGGAPSLVGRIKNFFSQPKIDKQRIAELGFGGAPGLMNHIKNFFSQPKIDKQRVAELGFGGAPSLVDRIKNFFSQPKIDKQRIAELGFGGAPSLVDRIKNFFSQPKIDKQRIAELGFGAFSAYGIISNVNAIILITIAWVSVVNATGGTPLLEANRARSLAARLCNASKLTHTTIAMQSS